MVMVMADIITEDTAVIMSISFNAGSKLEKEGQPEAVRSQFRAHIATTIFLLLGVLLLYISVPRVIAYAILAPWRQVEDALNAGDTVEPNDLMMAYKAHGRALLFVPHNSTILIDRARIARRLARAEGTGTVASEWQNAALSDLKAATVAAPRNGFAWAMLADAKLDTGALVADVVQELRLSWLTGPHQVSAMLTRIRITLDRWGEMPDDLKDRSLDELVEFWRSPHMRQAFVSLYIRANFDGRVAVRERLSAVPGALAKLDRLLLREIAPSS